MDVGVGSSRVGLAWFVWAATLVCAPILWAPLAIANDEGWPAAVIGGLLVLLMPTVALVMTSHRPANPVGWLLAGAALSFCFGFVVTQAATYGYHHGWVDSVLALLLAGANVAFVGLTLVPLALVVFPDGRPPSSRWRPLIVGNVVGAGLVILGGALATGDLEGDGFTVDSPLSVEALRAPAALSAVVGVALIVASTIGAAVAIVVRWRRGRAEERAQIKWVALVGSVALLVMLASQLARINAEVVVALAALLVYGGIPAAIAVAVLNYRLYDIDLLINRTVVYGVVTVGLAGLYVLIVGLSTQVLGDASETVAGVVAAALVAVAFAPFRDWVQRGVSRRLFGDRDQPLVAVWRLGERIDATVRASDLLPAIVDAVATSLRVPYVALRISHSGAEVSVGHPMGPEVEIPLLCQTVPVGTLRVSGRSSREPLSRADREVLARLAVHVGVAVQAATLSIEVERARARLVTAREEERRRLRRDLHDELGPILTGVGFGLDTVDNLVTRGSSGEEIHALLARLRDQTDLAIGEIRRVAYALRPRALDELGLVGALSAQAASLSGNTLHVRVTVEGAVDGLPAAVEAAAYRIGVEAMTNAARHANANRCDVTVHVADTVTLVISDDGGGLPAGYRAGVGLSSMRERADELGGRIDMAHGENCGCTVRAVLPLDGRWASA